jgi:hypothetical protein
MTDYSWLEPIERRTREVEAETMRLREAKMKPLPDKDRLRIMWQVAVTSAIEGQGELYEIYANLLYKYLTDTQPFCMLPDETTNTRDY